MTHRWIRASSLLALLVVATASGCGGAKTPSPAEQEQRLKDTEASMNKGMDAMKGIKPPKPQR
ncbi:MAG: hypothetical protein EBR86_02575 [Planctomycetia bacterium]|nr:hypothetical protein [Planctomycetia bacterium]